MNDTVYGGRRVTYTRRFFGHYLLEALLQTFTLFIGWLIWFAIVAPKGQTPAKQILSVRIHDYQTGAVASTGRVWMREFVGKFLLPILILIVALSAGSEGAVFFFYYGYWIAAIISMFVTPGNRALWDIIAGTVVRYHPEGLQPATAAGGRASAEKRLQELDLLYRRNLISDDEYEEKRRQVLAEL